MLNQFSDSNNLEWYFLGNSLVLKPDNFKHEFLSSKVHVTLIKKTKKIARARSPTKPIRKAS